MLSNSRTKIENYRRKIGTTDGKNSSNRLVNLKSTSLISKRSAFIIKKTVPFSTFGRITFHLQREYGDQVKEHLGRFVSRTEIKILIS